MKIESVLTITFSPTGTTRRTVSAIAAGLGQGDPDNYDMTLPGASLPDFSNFDKPLTIIGIPVHAGRVPPVAVERLRVMGAGWGKSVPAVLVVTYGNRHYDDALIELKDIALELGFVPVAGGAFIGEHSFSSKDLPVAAGRPDDADLAKASAFGAEVANYLDSLTSVSSAPDLEVPGNRPYRDGWSQPPMSPATDAKTCENCGTCADACPVGAISDDGLETDAEACIMCAACVRVCPTGARGMDHLPFIQGANKKLYENCSTRRDPEVFL